MQMQMPSADAQCMMYAAVIIVFWLAPAPASPGCDRLRHSELVSGYETQTQNKNKPSAAKRKNPLEPVLRA